MTSSSFRSGNASDDYQEESGILESETIEERLIDAFEDLSAKSAKTRLVSFDLIRRTLSQRCMIEFVYGRKVTLLDSLGRCIKRGKGQDVGHAATVIGILCTTIGPDPETDTIFSELISQLLALLADQTVQNDVRRSCARTIAICTYIIGIGGYLEQVMDRLYAIFSASCAKGDGTMPNPSEQLASLHNTCLQAWSLLLTAVNNSSPHLVMELVDEHMDKITELLDSPHLDVQLAAGETLAVMCEIIKSQNEDITSDDFDDLCDKLRDIVTDSQKSRGKRDIKQQRSNFREILATIEEEESPTITIKFGRERLILDSWLKRRQYDAFCELLGTGINQHLAENEVIRDNFGLGPAIVHLDLPRVRRSENSYEVMAANKSRSKNMRQLRDKRADVID